MHVGNYRAYEHFPKKVVLLHLFSIEFDTRYNIAYHHREITRINKRCSLLTLVFGMCSHNNLFSEKITYSIHAEPTFMPKEKENEWPV